MVQMTGNDGFSRTTVTTSTNPKVFDNLSTFGLRVLNSRLDFDNFVVSSPAVGLVSKPARSLVRATNAVEDLLSHWWQGDAASGQIANTWAGYTNNLPDPRGGLWERGTLYFVLDNFFQLTGDSTVQQRLRSDWQRTKTAYTPEQLEACGQDSGTNWACDDAGWSALMYLAAHRAMGDPDALNRAKGLFNNAYSRWYDDQMSGGFWYSDARHLKSLYQAALALAAIRIYEATRDLSYLERALQSYTWIEEWLLRPDGLYWCDRGTDGPIGAERPDDINEAGSVSFFGGNMAMGVIHARLFRITSDDRYRQRAVRTADALLRRLVNANGVYINDRDAWTDGTFVGDWAREVLSLRSIAPRHSIVLDATAEAISTRGRTPDGYYGGSWDGPADGPGSPWSRGPSKPQQIMVSANSANMIVAAAFLDSDSLALQLPELVLLKQSVDTPLAVVMSGRAEFKLQLDSSPDLKSWTTRTNYVSDGGPVLMRLRPGNEGRHQFFRLIQFPFTE